MGMDLLAREKCSVGVACRVRSLSAVRRLMTLWSSSDAFLFGQAFHIGPNPFNWTPLKPSLKVLALDLKA